MDFRSSTGSGSTDEISTKLHSSSYKGVIPQQNGRWGAQIYEHHRRIWLGTFGDETEAARAYDVAAQRFRGRDATTNFPPLSETDGTESASELAFLSAYSKTEIVDMLRKHTYCEELRQSRRNQQMGRNLGDRRSRGTWSERELLFYKVVTPSDVGKLNRLVIPKQQAEKHFPLRKEEKKEDNNNGVLLNFEDADGKVWRFRYSYWNSSQSYVLTKGWSQFVKEKGLNPGNVVSFWRYFDGSDMMQLLIDCKVVQKGEAMAMVPSSSSSSSSNAQMNTSENNDDRVFRLFGVNIAKTGKRKFI